MSDSPDSANTPEQDDSVKSVSVDTSESTRDEFPLAEITVSSLRGKTIGLSKMWIATLACLLLAVGLVWFSIEERGPELLVHFKQGHGLKPGDALRHRGIDIGLVTDVQLGKDLSEITVVAQLKPTAEGIARNGARFWIVRPQLDVSGVSGLETAVGSKYIAVSPARTPSPVLKREFIGLESPPVDDLGQEGLELILRGEEAYGVNPGSPVTWRGIEVGQVLSSSLSPDALHVDTRVRIEPEHQRLVSMESKFWSISGVNLELGVSGVEISAESLTTIARGGVAFITPGTSDKNKVQAGDVFTLHEEEDESWSEQASAIDMLEVHPPSMVQLKATWKESLLGFSRSKERACLGVVVGDANRLFAMVPTEFVSTPEKAIEGSLAFVAVLDGKSVALNTFQSEGETVFARVPLVDSDGEPIKIGLTQGKRFRVAEDLEDCFAVRTRGENVDLVLEAIGRHELTLADGVWRSSKSGLSRDVWCGAPVVSAADEKIVGILSFDDDHAIVLPMTTAALPK